ncbi:MAG: 30S ribosomal protein S6 [Candidatus Uhrbacteria bacterium]
MTYELLYIVPTRYTDAEVVDIQTKVNGIITKVGAKVVKEENLGRIRLAYPIKQTRHGSYILNYFEAETAMVHELEALLRLSSDILRHMVVQLPKGIPDHSFELESYVAPLSEEEEENRRATKRVVTGFSVPTKTPDFVQTETEPMVREEKALSMEELDKKLDEILDVNTSENI